MWKRNRLKAGLLAALVSVSTSVVHAASLVATDQTSIFAQGLYLLDNHTDPSGTVVVANQYTRKDGVVYTRSWALVGEFDDAADDLHALTPSALLLLPGNASGEQYPSDLVIQEKQDKGQISYEYARYNREGNKLAMSNRDVLVMKDLSGLPVADYLNETFFAANAVAYSQLKSSGIKFPKGAIGYLYQQSVIHTTYLDFSLLEPTEFSRIDDWLNANDADNWTRIQWAGYWIAQPKKADELWGVVEYQSRVYRALFNRAGDDSHALYKNNYFFNQAAFDALSEAVRQFYQ